MKINKNWKNATAHRSRATIELYLYYELLAKFEDTAGFAILILE